MGRGYDCIALAVGVLLPSTLPASQDPTTMPASHVDGAVVVSLMDSIDPVRNRFNDHRDRLRFMALFSPT